MLLIGSFKSRFAHGLLVISALGSKDTHDDWDAGSQNVHAGEDSIFVAVLDAIGFVTVTCVEEDSSDEVDGEEISVSGELSEVFTGTLTLASPVLEFSDPNQTIRMAAPMPANKVDVAIYTNDEWEATEVLVRVRAVEL